MAKVTRRGFLSSAGAVTGAVALGAATAGPTLIAAAADVAAPTAALPDQPVVAYVRNPKAGELRLMVGHREVAVKDRALVQRIVAAAR
jgi:3-hydroxyisobutyrate dehydrogenase-like beta-hydroxyacid dehydrogenase